MKDKAPSTGVTLGKLPPSSPSFGNTDPRSRVLFQTILWCPGVALVFSDHPLTTFLVPIKFYFRHTVCLDMDLHVMDPRYGVCCSREKMPFCFGFSTYTLATPAYSPLSNTASFVCPSALESASQLCTCLPSQALPAKTVAP